MHRHPIQPLRQFVTDMTEAVATVEDEARLVERARSLLKTLISTDDWLPADMAAPRADRYAQYLLHADPLDRFSVLSFVWCAGQRTPVHNHTVWGLVGVLRGAERCDEYTLHNGVPQASGDGHVMHPGDIDLVSPSVGDWHRVSHAHDGGVTVSIHVYGGNIGHVRRQRMDEKGALHDFVSGYDNAWLPNLWQGAAG
jgi:3-mercaptopropionate dioxygenase